MHDTMELEIVGQSTEIPMDPAQKAIQDLRNEIENGLMPKIVGQKSLKARLAQTFKTVLRGERIRPILIEAPRGFGKTTLMKSVAKRMLVLETGEPRDAVGFNGASLTSPTKFMEQVGPYLNGPDGVSKPVTVLIDEVHAAKTTVLQWLLSFIPGNNDNYNRITHGGQDFEIDFRYLTVIMATTDSQALSEAYKTRCARLVAEPYSKADIRTIFRNTLKDLAIQAEKKGRNDLPVHVTESVEEDIIGICRQTPRLTVSNADDIYNYVQNEGVEIFDRKAFTAYAKTMKVHPYGLNENEIRVLKALNERGPLKLRELAACTSLEKGMVQRDCELILIENDLIRVDEARRITSKGERALRGWE